MSISTNSSINTALSEARKKLDIPDELAKSGINTYFDLFEKARTQFSGSPAYRCMGTVLTFAEIDAISDSFAVYLQSLDFLKVGDRVAVQLPNLLQYPVVAMGVLKAGLVLVNVNPLYTSNVLENQLNDSGAELVITLSNLTAELHEIIGNTGVKKVLLTDVGDLFPQPKRWLVNFVVKWVRRDVPNLVFSHSEQFLDALKAGRGKKPSAVSVDPDDIAVLQYTGGTTGVAKGVMLTQKNLISCMRQVEWIYQKSEWETGRMRMITPLPLYHIYAFSVSFTHAFNNGHENVLITDPRDIKSFVKLLKKTPFDGLMGLNTLFNHLMNHKDFQSMDFSRVKLVLSGGMALSKSIADRWTRTTGSAIYEGYGLTECSGIMSVNCPGHAQLGTVGIVFPDVLIKIVDDNGLSLGCDEPGELLFKSPSAMKGYWHRDDATDELMDEEGYMRTGDIAVMQSDGFLKIVDRAKDMIIVSGFNVYPNEIEDTVIAHPDILECAAIAGKTDEGEYVRLFAVSNNPDLTEQMVRDYSREYLTAYKVPKKVVFVDEMPKSNVGKILRKELRDLYPE